MTFSQATGNIPIMLLLIGFPLLYQANSFMPWTKGLFVNRDRSYRAGFLASIRALHVMTTALAIGWLLLKGHQPAEIGLSPIHTAFALLVLGLVGLMLSRYSPKARHSSAKTGTPESDFSSIDLIEPLTVAERQSHVLTCLIAGFCEELLYRGIAITALIHMGLHPVYAVVCSSLSFTAIHGRAAFSTAGLYWFSKGAIYGTLFLWSGSLLPVIVIHVAWDLALLLRPSCAAMVTSQADGAAPV
jgi:membrane protease YdiL (CAAX protease family)